MAPWSRELLAPCLVLAGPTAVGKTAVALELAPRLNAEIVALDSMTLYRGMDIGTAKPTAAEQARVPHHLLDVLDPHEEYSVADYLGAAADAVARILNRGKRPLFVGGAGLYLKGLLRGVFEGPAANWPLRHELEEIAAREGPAALHERLRLVDPTLAQRLPPTDTRRVIRGLEVFQQTGTPLSQLQQQQGPRPAAERPARVSWLAPRREWLAQRIDTRVEAMFAQGFCAEVDRLRHCPGGVGRTAGMALGYKELLAAIAAGREPATTLAEIQLRTRQFAKRQQTWFRGLEECLALPVEGTESAAALADRLLTEWALPPG
ncbi:MAG: tRNA (adenosine(37)-N6)-dimethylallyltransferase MiaA [Planctomycetaceae bacterium]